MVIRSLDEPDIAPRRWREGLPPGPECRRAMADQARSYTDDPAARATIDIWFGVEREPARLDDGSRGAVALLATTAGLVVPFAAALGPAEMVGAAGLGVLAAGCVVAALALDRGSVDRGDR